MGYRFAVVAVVVGALACGGGNKRNAATPGDSQATLPKPERLVAPMAAEAPPELFGVVVVPDPTAALRAVNALYGRLVPGSQPIEDAVIDLLVGSLVGGTPTSGIDHGKPLQLLFVDPAAADRWIVALVGVRDEQALRAWADGDGMTADVRGSIAVVGSPDAVPIVAEYAATNLAAKPLPRHVTATAFLERIRTRYSRQLEEFFDAMETGLRNSPDPTVARAARAYTEIFYSIVHQTDTASLSYEQSDRAISLVFEVTGGPESTIAKVAAAQKPSDYSVLDVFDPGSAPIVAAGGIDWEPMSDSFFRMMEVVIPEMSSSEEAQGVWRQLMKQYAGQMMFRVELSPFRMVSAYQVKDPKEAVRLNRIWSENEFGNGMKLKLIGAPSFTHGGVAVDEYSLEFDKSKLPPLQANNMLMEWLSAGKTTSAAIGSYLVTVMSVDAGDVMKQLVDTLARGDRGTASKQPVPTESRRRRESLVTWVNIGAIVAIVAPHLPPVDSQLELGLGFTDTSWQFRLSMGLDDLAALAGLGAGAAQAATPPPPGRVPQSNPKLVADIDALADEACACKTIECADAVQERLMDLVRNAAEPPMDEQEKIMKSLERMGECMGKIAAESEDQP